MDGTFRSIDLGLREVADFDLKLISVSFWFLKELSYFLLLPTKDELKLFDFVLIILDLEKDLCLTL